MTSPQPEVLTKFNIALNLRTPNLYQQGKCGISRFDPPDLVLGLASDCVSRNNLPPGCAIPHDAPPDSYEDEAAPSLIPLFD